MIRSVLATVALAVGMTCLTAGFAAAPAAPAALDLRTAELGAVGSVDASFHDDRWIDNESWWWTAPVTADVLLRSDAALNATTHANLPADLYDQYKSTFYGNFTNQFYDDTGWWGEYWVAAYRATNEQRYLFAAEEDDAWLAKGWDKTCGGGVWWDQAHHEKNTITNDLYLALSAHLAQVTGLPFYVRRAQATWDWMQSSGLARSGMARGTLDAQCRPAGPAWSYNQGELIAGLVALADVSHNSAPLARAEQIAALATSSPRLMVDGALTDPCEPPGVCGVDGGVFKGILADGLADLDQVDGGKHVAWLSDQAALVHRADRDGNAYGLHWSGPATEATSATDTSVVALYAAALTKEN